MSNLPAPHTLLALLWQQERLHHSAQQYNHSVLAELRGVPVPSSGGTVQQLGQHRCALHAAGLLDFMMLWPCRGSLRLLPCTPLSRRIMRLQTCMCCCHPAGCTGARG